MRVERHGGPAYFVLVFTVLCMDPLAFSVLFAANNNKQAFNFIVRPFNKECNRKQHSRTEGFRSVISIRNVIGNCTLEPKASDLSFQ
jgi:preprotein translocase subunit Sec63